MGPISALCTSRFYDFHVIRGFPASTQPEGSKSAIWQWKQNPQVILHQVWFSSQILSLLSFDDLLVTFWWPFGVLPTISYQGPVVVTLGRTLWSPFDPSGRGKGPRSGWCLPFVRNISSVWTKRHIAMSSLSFLLFLLLFKYIYITCTGTWRIPIQHYNCFVTIAAIASEWKCDEALANWNAHLSRVAWESSNSHFIACYTRYTFRWNQSDFDSLGVVLHHYSIHKSIHIHITIYMILPL